MILSLKVGTFVEGWNPNLEEIFLGFLLFWAFAHIEPRHESWWIFSQISAISLFDKQSNKSILIIRKKIQIIYSFTRRIDNNYSFSECSLSQFSLPSIWTIPFSTNNHKINWKITFFILSRDGIRTAATWQIRSDDSNILMGKIGNLCRVDSCLKIFIIMKEYCKFYRFYLFQMYFQRSLRSP